MKQALRTIAAGGMLMVALAGTARADVVLTGPTSTAGTYSASALSALATPGTTVSDGGLTGVSLWGLLGGADSASATAPVYGAITTSTPAGFNNKNAILRYYLLATSAGGAQSVVSLGEIDPFFGGASGTAAFVAYGDTGGGLLSAPELVVPGAPGRGLSDLASLQLLAVAPKATGGSGASTGLSLSGAVNNPGTYTKTDLQTGFTPLTETVGTDSYTGVPLWTFLNPSGNEVTDKIVVTTGTDGYEVVLALAELDPSLGGNPNDLLAYDGTGFPGAGLVRTIYPLDTARKGRFMTNGDSITVEDVPEPASLALLALGLAGIAIARARPRGAAPAQ